MKRVASVAILAALVILSASSAEASTINVNSNGVVVPVVLGPGTYKITPIGTALGGTYNAWSPWGFADPGCNQITGDCGALAGYVWFVYYDSSSLGTGNVRFATGRWANPTFALNAAISQLTNVTFTLAGSETVNFYIFDDVYADNVGGVSFDLSLQQPTTPPGGAVPEPSTIVLLGLGLAGAAARIRRRTQQT